MSTNPADLVEGGNGGFPNVKPWPAEAFAEINRLRAAIKSLSDSHDVCVFGYLNEICDGCGCHRKPRAQLNTQC